jgi:aminoglycoside phosphotransferase (APT) family kinase protein
MSHANHLLHIETDGDGARVEVVLRRWVRPNWQDDDPEFSPEQEAATYGLLARSAVPAPRLLAADAAARECDVPAVLLTRAPGGRMTGPLDMPSFLAQLAQVLPVVHGVDPEQAAQSVPPYRPYYDRSQLLPPSWTRQPSLWERAIELGTGSDPGGPSVFIHRDYQQGNTLWSAGRLTAIVDWTSASFGPAAVDLAHMRVNLAMSFGVKAADTFLAEYGAAIGGSFTLDPYWDLRATVDLVPELPFPGQPAVELARIETFVARALAAR